MTEGPDLFGQVPVTWPEVVDWCARVAGITPDSPRFLPYVQSWRVVEKIAASKLANFRPPLPSPELNR
ncbi:MAG TPA: hypothetical protein VF522_13080 [Ramlibacter sp.]|uniref:hypothetical protein n=1 Tax=Ramlibacter sp. TaxID=1917967 RepID=UPI002ED15BC5